MTLARQHIAHCAIQHFKSIRALAFDAKRINLIIGLPDSGKSNILEALSLGSREMDKWWYRKTRKQLLPLDFLRVQHVRQLFFDMDISNDIEVRFENEGAYGDPPVTIGFQVQNGTSKLYVRPFVEIDRLNLRFYRYNKSVKFIEESQVLTYLALPDGENLPWVLANSPIANYIGYILGQQGFILAIDPANGTINKNLKSGEHTELQFSHTLWSDTLKRLVFFLTAIESNQDAVLLFEEPEANTYPFYTQVIAEHIVNKTDCQFFIVTHSPYLINTLLDKTGPDELAVHIASTVDRATNLHTLTADQLQQVRDENLDLLFNMDRFLPE
jgi:AAA15 family ATPase/GTPase